MMTLNLAPVPRLGPVFDPADARGWMRFVPRQPWWPILPFVVLAAPGILATLALRRLTQS